MLASTGLPRPSVIESPTVTTVPTRAGVLTSTSVRYGRTEIGSVNAAPASLAVRSPLPGGDTHDVWSAIACTVGCALSPAIWRVTARSWTGANPKRTGSLTTSAPADTVPQRGRRQAT